jgi:putative peptidoglycan lipid II flippase
VKALTEPSAAPPSGRSARWVAIGILLSRMAGLLREILFARYFGTSRYADVFRAALRMPNVLQNLLGEGTLSASFIPVYAALLEKGKEKEAGRVAGAIFALLMAVAGVLTLFGMVAAPILVSLFFPGFDADKKALTVTCTRIIFPMTGVLVLSAWTLGVLNSHRRFFLSYVAPVLWNVAMIATMLWFGFRQPERDLVVTLAWGAFVGGLLQFGVQLPSVLRLERRLKIRLNLKLQGVREAVRTAGHAISGRGVVQLSGWADMFLASLMGTGAIAALGYAQTLYMLPISLFGMSVAAAELPELARNRDAAVEQLVRRVNAGLKQIAVLVIPSAVGYLLLGEVVVAGLYERGVFTPSDTFLVSLVLIGYTVGLPASTATRLFSSAFFAVQDTRTPARIAYLRVGVAALLGGLVTIWVKVVEPGHVRYGPVGLALASGLAAWLEWSLLRRKLRLRLPAIGLGRKLVAKLIAIAGVTALIGRGIAWLLPDWHPILIAALVIGLYGVLYLALVQVLGIHANIPLVSRFLPGRKPESNGP